MIKCANCGAQYEEQLRQCPYCGAENTELTEREYQGELDQLDRQTRELVHLPSYLVKLWTRRWGKALILLLFAVLAAGIVTAGARAVGVYIANRGEPARQQKHLEMLDSYVEAEDYEAIWDYLNKHDLYGGVYSEYSDIYFAAYPLYYVEECRSCLDRGGVWRDTAGWALMEASQGILDIDQNLDENTYIHGGEEAMQIIRGKLMSFLIEEMGLAEAEMENLYQLCRETETMEETQVKVQLFYEAGEKAMERKGIRILEDDEILD